jgi:hypothetical protein
MDVAEQLNTRVSADVVATGGCVRPSAAPPDERLPEYLCELSI